MINLEEIEARISRVPDDLDVKEVLTPLSIKDPKDPKRLIRDPEGKMKVQRVEVFSKANPNSTYFHYHVTEKAPHFNPSWREHADLILNLKSDMRFLINEIKRLKGEK